MTRIQKKEYILCSAIWYDDSKERAQLPKNIKTGIVSGGARHCNCYPILYAINKRYENNSIDGFLTSKNRFVDRKEAMKIALRRGQTKKKYIHNPKIGLHSEDLY